MCCRLQGFGVANAEAARVGLQHCRSGGPRCNRGLEGVRKIGTESGTCVCIYRSARSLACSIGVANIEGVQGSAVRVSQFVLILGARKQEQGGGRRAPLSQKKIGHNSMQGGPNKLQRYRKTDCLRHRLGSARAQRARCRGLGNSVSTQPRLPVPSHWTQSRAPDPWHRLHLRGGAARGMHWLLGTERRVAAMHAAARRERSTLAALQTTTLPCLLLGNALATADGCCYSTGRCNAGSVGRPLPSPAQLMPAMCTAPAPGWHPAPHLLLFIQSLSNILASFMPSSTCTLPTAGGNGDGRELSEGLHKLAGCQASGQLPHVCHGHLAGACRGARRRGRAQLRRPALGCPAVGASSRALAHLPGRGGTGWLCPPCVHRPLACLVP